jgi:predicted PurR-regulated permease PerM
LGEIGGVVGAVVAVPLAATLQVVVRELLSLRAVVEFQDQGGK